VPALRGRALNHPVVRWLKTVVLSDREKAWLWPRQVGTGKAIQKRSAGETRRGVVVEASKWVRWHRNRGAWNIPRDEPGGCPRSWPGGVRRRGGASPVCGSCMEREKASVDAASGVVGPKGRVRERAEAETVGTEYRCGARRRTGP